MDKNLIKEDNKKMSLEFGELVVRLTRKCSRCPGLMVAGCPPVWNWKKLHYICEVCGAEDEHDIPRNIEVVWWQKERRKKEQRVDGIKCGSCHFCGANYITSLQSQGVYRFSFCGYSPTDLRMVEPDILRECEHYSEKAGE